MWYSHANAELTSEADAGSPAPLTLYHASPVARPIEQAGGHLLTRREVKQQGGRAALGGGRDDAISFTADANIARQISESMLENRQYARRERTLPQLAEDARTGVGTGGKPWLPYGRGWDDYGRSGRWEDAPEYARNIHDRVVEPQYQSQADANPDYHDDHVMDLLDQFRPWRERAGGSISPWFYNVRASDWRDINPDHVGYLEYKVPHHAVLPNSTGNPGTDSLREFRIKSGHEAQFVQGHYSSGPTAPNINPNTDPNTNPNIDPNTDSDAAPAAHSP